jgi:hypothetical protein
MWLPVKLFIQQNFMGTSFSCLKISVGFKFVIFQLTVAKTSGCYFVIRTVRA